MEYVILLLLFLAALLIVAFTIANHYQVKINQRLKIEYDYKLLVLKQLYQLDELQRSHRELLAENKALSEQSFRIQREQLLASLN